MYLVISGTWGSEPHLVPRWAHFKYISCKPKVDMIACIEIAPEMDNNFAYGVYLSQITNSTCRYMTHSTCSILYAHMLHMICCPAINISNLNERVNSRLMSIVFGSGKVDGQCRNWVFETLTKMTSFLYHFYSSKPKGWAFFQSWGQTEALWDLK